MSASIACWEAGVVRTKKMMVMMEKNPKPPSFPSFDSSDDIVDDDDDCIICGKLLLKHSQEQANECYNFLVKRKLFHQELRKK